MPATAEAPIDHGVTRKRVVLGLFVTYFSPTKDFLGNPNLTVLTAPRGSEIELTEAEEKRLDSLGMLAPKHLSGEDVQRIADQRLDIYRAERGDQEAVGRANERALMTQPPVQSAPATGGIVRSDVDVEGWPVATLAAWISDETPNAEDTIALAEGDSLKAAKVLEAEQMATGGDPRKGVETALRKLIEP